MKVPVFAIKENHASEPVFNAGAVPTVNPDSNITEAMDAFLTSQITNKKTARGYRRHITHFIGMQCLERFLDLKTINLAVYRSELMNDGRGDATHAQALIGVRSFLCWASAMMAHNIRWETINYLLPVPKGGTIIHVRQGKGNKDRLMPVRKEVRASMEAYLKATDRRVGQRGEFFQSEDRALASRDSWRLSTKTASKIVRTTVELAGIENRVTPPGPRHGGHDHALRRAPRQVATPVRHPGVSRRGQRAPRETVRQVRPLRRFCPKATWPHRGAGDREPIYQGHP